MYTYEALQNLIDKISTDAVKYLQNNEKTDDELLFSIEQNVNEANKIIKYFLTDPSQIINKTSELLRPLQKIIEFCIINNFIDLDNLLLLQYISNIIYEFTNIYRIRKIITLFNNEIKYLEPLINAIRFVNHWQIIYVLSLWLSLLIMVPIKLSNIDTDGNISDKIIKLSLHHLNRSDKTRESFSFLLSNFLARDLTHLDIFSGVKFDNDFIKIGVLSTLKKILKMVTPEEVQLIYINSLLKSIDCFSNTVAHKLYISAKCRLMLILLDKDLDFNLSDYIDELLNGLESQFNSIRWVSAKALGRLSKKLGEDFSNEIILYILNLYSVHGKCLGIGEIIRSSNIKNLLSTTIDQIIDVGVSALCIKPGLLINVNNVIDSACFLFWSMASINVDILSFEQKLKIVQSLVNNSLFDISINSRRCASASLQEFIGRQSSYPVNIPNSLEIATMLDYYSISSQSHNYTRLAIEIANLKEDNKNYYSKSVLDHLLTHKLYHNDLNTKILTCACISKIKILFDKNYIYNYLATSLPQLYNRDVPYNTKHGILLLINSVIDTDVETALAGDLLYKIMEIPVNAENMLLFKLGELMREEVCKLIGNIMKLFSNKLDGMMVTIGRIRPKSVPISQVYINIIMDSLKSFSLPSQVAASDTLKYIINDDVFNTLCDNIVSDNLSFNVRRGSAIAFGFLPFDYIKNKIEKIINILADAVINNINSFKDALLRQYCLVSISMLIEKTDFNCIDKLVNLLEVTTQDYEKDDRGDVGSWVRVTSLEVIATLIGTNGDKSQYNKRLLYSILSCCLEKSERVRSRALWVLHTVLNNNSISATEIRDRVYYNKNYEKYPSTVEELLINVDDELKSKLESILRYLNTTIMSVDTPKEYKMTKEVLNVGLRLDYYSNLEIAFKSVSIFLTDGEFINKSIYNIICLFACEEYQKTLSRLITFDVEKIFNNIQVERHPLESFQALEFLIINDKIKADLSVIINKLPKIKGNYKILKAKISFLVTTINFCSQRESVDLVVKYLKHKYPTIREYTSDKLMLIESAGNKIHDIIKETNFKYIDLSDPVDVSRADQAIEEIKHLLIL